MFVANEADRVLGVTLSDFALTLLAFSDARLCLLVAYILLYGLDGSKDGFEKRVIALSYLVNMEQCTHSPSLRPA